MKTFAALLIALAAFTVHAETETGDVQDVAKKAGITEPCAHKIVAEATRLCNSESRAAEHENREHECFYNYDLTGMDKGVLTIGYTVGDADEWNYGVTVTEKPGPRGCQFTIKSQNQ